MVVPVAAGDSAHPVSIYGRISGHLIAARDTALAHDTNSTLQRMTIEAVVAQIDVLIAAVRRLHHQTTLND